MSKVAIYCRQSKTRQDSNSPSIDIQIENCTRTAERTGDEVVGIYKDSNAPADSWHLRKDWDRLVDDASKGKFTKIYADNRDRLWRDDDKWRLFTTELAEYGVTHIVTPSGERTTDYADNPDGEFSDGLDAMIAKRENRIRAKRVRDQRLRYAHEGKPHVTRTRPFGLSRDWLTINEDEKAIIEEMANRVLGGDSPNNIANDLNARGIETTTGRDWQAGSVTDLLQQPRLIGKRVHKGETYPSAYIPVILDDVTFRRVGQRLAVKNRRTRTDYLLSSLLTCGKCGFNLWSRPGKDRAYCCPSPKTSSTHGESCGRMFITATKVEDRVTRYVIDRLNGGLIDDVIDMLQAEKDDEKLVKARNQLKLETEKRDELRDQLDSGNWSDVTVILSAIEKANERIAEHQAVIDNESTRVVNLPEAWKLPPFDWYHWFDNAPLSSQRKMITMTVDSITIKSAGRHWKKGAKQEASGKFAANDDRVVIEPRQVDERMASELAELAILEEKRMPPNM